MASVGASTSKSKTDNKYELAQTYKFDPNQQKQLQGRIFDKSMGALGSINFGDPGSVGGYASGLVGGGGVGGGYDKAVAGKFTDEFDPILEKLTKGPMIEKALAQFLDPIAEQNQASRQQILERASAGGVLDSGGALKAEILNADAGLRAKQGARSQAYLGSLGQAVGATSNQVNAITSANSANAGASASLSGALAGANAQIQSAGIGARAGLAGQLLDMPLKYASLLDPTFSNDRLKQSKTKTSGFSAGLVKG